MDLLPVIDEVPWLCDQASQFPNTDGDVVDRVRRRVENGARVYLGFSGGKDSTVTAKLLQSLDIPFTAVFEDTRWESYLTYNYVRWFCHHNDIELVEVANDDLPDGLVSAIDGKGCFPTRKRRYCTELLKEKPMAEFLDARRQAGEDVISVAGIRAQESAQRAKMSVWVDNDSRFGCDVWHPVITWTEADVIAYHHMTGTKPNPLYLLGASRVGCFPCALYASKAEMRIVSVLMPERIDMLRGLESRVDQAVRDRKGDAYESRNYPTSTMFAMSINGQSRPALIDDVIQRAWTGATKREKAIIEAGSLAEQAAIAQRKWGYTLQIDGVDIDKVFAESADADHADYSERYLTTKELKKLGRA